MKNYRFVSKVKWIILCLVGIFIMYLTLLNLPVNYQHINLGNDDLASFEFRYVPDRTFTDKTFTDKTFSDNGQFMQMVDIPEDINHMIGEVIPDDDVEYFIDSPELNKVLIYNDNLAPLEMVPSLGLNNSDTTFLNDGGFIQMYEVSDETDYIITEIMPNSDIEYFINPVQLSNPTIQDLEPLENIEE